MSVTENPQHPFLSCDYKGQEAQLIMGLKHHFSQTLSEVPLEVAIQAVSKVWQSCQNESVTQREDVIHL